MVSPARHTALLSLSAVLLATLLGIAACAKSDRSPSATPRPAVIPGKNERSPDNQNGRDDQKTDLLDPEPLPQPPQDPDAGSELADLHAVLPEGLSLDPNAGLYRAGLQPWLRPNHSKERYYVLTPSGDSVALAVEPYESVEAFPLGVSAAWGPADRSGARKLGPAEIVALPDSLKAIAISVALVNQLDARLKEFGLRATFSPGDEPASRIGDPCRMHLVRMLNGDARAVASFLKEHGFTGIDFPNERFKEGNAFVRSSASPALLKVLPPSVRLDAEQALADIQQGALILEDRPADPARPVSRRGLSAR